LAQSLDGHGIVASGVTPALRLALYQPDIPQNTGTILRLCACLGVAVDIVEPAGFDMSDRALKRAGLDYLAHVALTRHADWATYAATPRPGRLVLLTAHGATRLDRFAFEQGDTLLLGRESAGAPPEVHAAADARLRIPMRAGLRSLNIAVAAALALGEALRQLDAYPAD
jgi:tRNA (cytidine/uridine-2'-O-)-methyltransferase